MSELAKNYKITEALVDSLVKRGYGVEAGTEEWVKAICEALDQKDSELSELKLQIGKKDELLKKISISDIAEEQKKVILQDRDLGAKNVAIKQALSKIEPDDTPGNEDDKVIIVLR